MSEVIYRVQDSDGRGPWKPGFSSTWVEHRPDHENLLPWFIEFGPVHRTSVFAMHVGTGCLSIEQLRRWFTPSEYKTLRSHEYHSVKMSVNTILAYSDKQCVFERTIPLNQEVELIELYPE